MFDITLYGHLFNDTIYDGQLETMALGGIANCWKALNTIDSNLSVGLSPTSLSEANIYIERKHSKRNSIPSFNLEVFEPRIKPSKISHIMYINELPNVDFLPKLDGIISADTCKGAEIENPNVLEFIDYLFVSDEDGQDIDFLRKNTKGFVILHSSKGSKILRKTDVFDFVVPNEWILDDVNVLGAGDFFAASFLYAIHKGWTKEGAVQAAHCTTSDLIRKYNEEV
jgi:sugar/nucleoside kinase (ribokinase family)